MDAGRWNSETTIKFIQEFKNHECLWNQKLSSYKNKYLKEAAYLKIVAEMNITGFGVPKAKKKMRSLRSTYYQEKRKINNAVRSGSGTNTLYVSTIPWYGEIDSVLKEADARRTTVHNVTIGASSDIRETCSIDSDTYEVANEDINFRPAETPSIPAQVMGESARSPVKSLPKQKGIFRAIVELRKLQQEINSDISVTSVNEDRFDIFGKSVAVQLRELSFERAMLGQAKIQDILTELSIENHRHTNMSASTDTLATSDISAPGFNTFQCTSHSADPSANISGVSKEILDRMSLPGYSGEDILSRAITMTLGAGATMLEEDTE